jgi:hypothetical protein
VQDLDGHVFTERSIARAPDDCEPAAPELLDKEVTAFRQRVAIAEQTTLPELPPELDDLAIHALRAEAACLELASAGQRGLELLAEIAALALAEAQRCLGVV